MYILFDTEGNSHFIEDERELDRELLKLCFAWTNDDRYEDDMDYKALFNSCRENHDFGDIAQVFKCDKSEIGFYLTEVGETITLTRIY